MTLIVAAKSKHAVVIAADRQISFDHSALRTDIEKVYRVDFQNLSVAVALADNVTNSLRFIAILKGTAKHCSPQTPDEVGLVVQRAMEQLRREIGKTYAGENNDLNALITQRSLNCSITVGFSLNWEPHIVQTNLLAPTYYKTTAEYETDGCGSNLANFFLAEYFTPKSDLEHTALIAIYAVWAVIEYDRYCKGPITVWIACPPGGLMSNGKPRALQFSQSRIDDLVAIVKEIDAATKETKRNVVNEQFEIRRQRLLKFIEREVASLPPPTKAELKEMAEEIEEDRKRAPSDFMEQEPPNS
jgi:20S proteasome alpha/beta subunit